MKKYLNKRVRLFFCTLLFSTIGLAQTDTEFWFAAPELVPIGSGRVTQLKFGFVTYDHDTKVRIIQPANSTFDTVTLVIPANSYMDHDLFNLRNICVETKPSNKVLNFGFQILSNYPITAYYQVNGDDSEIYTLKGRSALGDCFIVPMQYTLSGKGQEDGARHSIEIVAAEDNTLVTAIVSENCERGGGISAITKGDTVRYRLNKGQSVSLRTNLLGNGAQLRNTVVYTNGRKIAVNTTDDMAVQGSAADLIGDQIVPVALTGNTYAAYSGGEAVEFACLFPITDTPTQIYANGSLITTLSTTGELGTVKEFTYDIPKGVTLFTSDGNNFITFQITGVKSGGQELGGTMLPNLLCTGSREIAYKPLFGTPKALLFVKDIDKGGFSINGGIPGQFIAPTQFLPLANGWSYYVGSLPAWGGAIRLKNETGIFHFAVLDAAAATCSYGYFSNYNEITINAISNTNYYIEGDNASLSLENYSGLSNITWELPDGIIATRDSISISDIKTDMDGVYIVSATSVDGCTIVPDTVFVNVFPSDIEKKTIITACENNNITLTAEGYAPFTWSHSASENKQTINLIAADSQNLTVKTHKRGTNMAVLLPDTICKLSKNIFSYLIPTTIEENIRYVFSADVKYVNSPSIPTNVYFTINGTKIGPAINLSQNNVYQFAERIWTSDAAEAQIGLVSDSDRELCVANIKFTPLFEFVDTFSIEVSDSLKPTIQGNTTICNNQTVLSILEEYDSYLWSSGDTSRTITVRTAGEYTVRVSEGDCHGSNTVTISSSPTLKIDIDTIYELCYEESIGGTIVIPYIEIEGIVGSYSIHFESQNGFDNINYKIPRDKCLEIAIPNTNLPPGIYRAELITTERGCGSISKYKLSIVINYPTSILTQRWNDIISVKNSNFNGGYTFTAFQWYKNGNPITNATKSYYYETNGFSNNPPDKYRVLLTNESGQQILTCNFEPEYIPESRLQMSFVRSRALVSAPEEKGKVTTWTLSGNIYSIQEINNWLFIAPEIPGIYIISTDNYRWKLITTNN